MQLARPRGHRRSGNLLEFARETAADPRTALMLPQRAGERTWAKIEGPDLSEAWVIGWPAGTRTGWHDHGGSRGAFVVMTGELREHIMGREVVSDDASTAVSAPAGVSVRTLASGDGRGFGPRHIHDVTNDSSEFAVSVHVYDPGLPLMRRYELRDGVLEPTFAESPGAWS